MKLISSISREKQDLVRASLESRLEDARIVTNENILKPENLEKCIIPYISQDSSLNERIFLKEALNLAQKYHPSNQVRESGDYYLTHPVKAAIILNAIGADMITKAGALLHDTVEHNPERIEEIIRDMNDRRIEEVIPYVLAMTPPDNIEEVIQKKEMANAKIVAGGKNDPYKKLYAIRVSERLDNLLTLKYMGPKNGLSGYERQQRVINDTGKNVLHLAEEVDKAYGSEIRIRNYMVDIMKGYDLTPSHLSIINSLMSAGVKSFLETRRALKSSQ